jgi:hypothetical protein
MTNRNGAARVAAKGGARPDSRLDFASAGRDRTGMLGRRDALPGGLPGKDANAELTTINSITDRQFHDLVRRLHCLGPRPCGEILLEFAPDLDVLIQRLERYAEIDPDLVRIADATDWIQPEDLLREVPA